jgi:hypothetical protein
MTQSEDSYHRVHHYQHHHYKSQEDTATVPKNPVTLFSSETEEVENDFSVTEAALPTSGIAGGLGQYDIVSGR